MSLPYVTAAELCGIWLADVASGKPPTRFDLPTPFETLDVRPGRLILLGGAPGAGKTAALLQVAVELLRRHEGARVLMANVEMTPTLLLERIAARIAGVPLADITDRRLSLNQRDRLGAALQASSGVFDRLAFQQPPFAFERLADAATAFEANVLVLDYIQRFTIGNGGDKREQLETASTALRRCCDLGAVVLVASAVARQKGRSGSNYAGLNLASFRGSSELEYGADAAFVMEKRPGGVLFKCEKNRHGEMVDIATVFDGATQCFVAAPTGLAAFDATPQERGNKNKEVR